MLGNELYSEMNSNEVNCYDHFSNFMDKIKMPWSAQLYCYNCEQNDDDRKLSLYFDEARELVNIDGKINNAISEFCGCNKSNESHFNDILNVEIVTWHEESEIEIGVIPAAISVEGRIFNNAVVTCWVEQGTKNHFFCVGSTNQGTYIKYDDANCEPVPFPGKSRVNP